MESIRYELRPCHIDGDNNAISVPFSFIYELEGINVIAMYENAEDGTQDHLIDFEDIEQAWEVLAYLTGKPTNDVRISSIEGFLTKSKANVSRIRYLLANPFFTG